MLYPLAQTTLLILTLLLATGAWVLDGTATQLDRFVTACGVGWALAFAAVAWREWTDEGS